MKQRVKLSLDDEGTLDGKMEKLAIAMADDLLKNTPIGRPKIEGFAKLTSYFTATRRLTGGGDEPAKPGFTFAAAKARMSGANGSKPREN